MSAYRTAIDQTARTIERRARYFRNQVVIVVTISALVVIAAMVSWSPSALWGFFLLVPACGLFFYADNRALNEWRFQQLAAWNMRDIDFAAFRESICANPALPKATTVGMLMTLPSVGDIASEQRISSNTREAIAAVITALYACRSDVLAFKVASYVVVTGSVIAAAGLETWHPLLGIFAVMPLPVLLKWARVCRLRNTCRNTLAVHGRPDFDPGQYRESVDLLDWAPISPLEKAKYLATVQTSTKLLAQVMS